MNKSRDGFKSPFGFTVVHAIRKNFAFPLAVFVMSLALYLRSFFGSDKIRQLTALELLTDALEAAIDKAQKQNKK